MWQEEDCRTDVSSLHPCCFTHCGITLNFVRLQYKGGHNSPPPCDSSNKNHVEVEGSRCVSSRRCPRFQPLSAPYKQVWYLLINSISGYDLLYSIVVPYLFSSTISLELCFSFKTEENTKKIEFKDQIFCHFSERIYHITLCYSIFFYMWFSSCGMRSGSYFMLLFWCLFINKSLLSALCG